MVVKIRNHGDFAITKEFLTRMKSPFVIPILKKYGEKGVQALAEATPKDTGTTASSWSYEILQTKNGYTLAWNNANVSDHVNIAMILQYGHGTRNGGYVQGVDYINPALVPLFEGILMDAWKEVTR